MGPPPKKGRNFEPQYWSGWVDTPSCDCPDENRIAYEYKWFSVQMVSGAASGWGTTLRVFVGILSLGITEAAIHKKDFTHECVVVYFRCKKCGHKFSLQYEIINAREGKQMNYGRYQKCLDIRQHGSIDHSFAFVQQCYDKMWQNYETFGHCCYHWAKDFCFKLYTGNPNGFVYGYYG